MTHFIKKTLSLIIFSVLTATPAIAANVGDKIPHNLDLSDQTSTQQSFQSISGENGAVILFIRSAEWCPYCQAQLMDVNSRLPEIRGAGYNVVSVSYDSIDSLDAFVKQRGIDYPLLSDKNSEAIKAFNLLNKEIREGSKQDGIPHPAIIVTNEQGLITHVFKEDGYKNRPDMDDVVAALKE